jgi:hypothetical protein
MSSSFETDPIRDRTGLTAQERSERSRAAAHARWSHVSDRAAELIPANAGLLKKYADEIDPCRLLPADVLAKQVENMRLAHLHRANLKSMKAARLRREQRQVELKRNGGDNHAA